MNRSLVAGGLLLASALLAGAVLRWHAGNDAEARRRWKAAIRATFDPARDSGWIETFETDRTVPLGEHDPRWRPLFGRLLVDRRLAAAVGDPEGGWERDGGDDYAFRVAQVPAGSVEITVDGWWDGMGSFGAQGAVQPDPPHRLYEAAVWRGRLSLIHFIGPGPDKYEVLAESPPLGIGAGFYRLTFCMDRSVVGWQLRALLGDPSRENAIIAHVAARDGRLGAGGQGIGLLGGGGGRHSYITGISVRQRTPPSPDSTRVPRGHTCDFPGTS